MAGAAIAKRRFVLGEKSPKIFCSCDVEFSYSHTSLASAIGSTFSGAFQTERSAKALNIIKI
jgi:hypothetical protein